VKLPFLRAPAGRDRMELPLFPLRTVLFPGGLLPLKVFEQRYIEMTKACMRDEAPFGVCLITRGSEVAAAAPGPAGAAATPAFAPIGTLARITGWDMPQGVLHLTVQGGTRFQVRAHAVRGDGLVVGEVSPLAAEPAVALADAFAPLARLLEVIAARVGPQQFPAAQAWDDASWVGYRLAELLPLPLPIKQSMLEINDASVRLNVLQKFLRQQGLLEPV
jgi:Lon protease-like protein